MYDGSLEVQLYYEQFIICREWKRNSLPWLICHHLIFLHFILQTEISSQVAQRMIKMFFGLGHIIWKNKQRLEETFLLNAAFTLFHNVLPYKRVLYLSISLHLPIVIVLMVQHKDFGDQKILYYVRTPIEDHDVQKLLLRPFYYFVYNSKGSKKLRKSNSFWWLTP